MAIADLTNVINTSHHIPANKLNRIICSKKELQVNR